MESLVDMLTAEWATFVAMLPRLLLAAAVLPLSYYLGRTLARMLSAVWRRTSLRAVHESFVRTTFIALALFVGLIVALNILGLEKMAISVLAGGGVTAIVLGFAFREIGENFLAGIFLAFSRPFKTGDAIRTEDIEGKVQDIELRYTHLRTDDGRDIYVPSSQLFNKPVTNFTKDGLRRVSFTAGIDYSDDAKKACSVLQETISVVRGVLGKPAPGAYISSLEPQYVEIKVFYWIDVFDKDIGILAIRTEVMNECRKALLREGFTVSSETTSNIAIVKTADS